MTPNDVLRALRSQIVLRARAIQAPLGILPTLGRAAQDARPGILLDDGAYHYVIRERGREVSRETFTDTAALLYRCFADVTGTMAANAAIGEDDYRRVMFDHQLALLRMLDPGWAERREAEIAIVLARHP